MWIDLLETATPIDAQMPLGIKLLGGYNRSQFQNALSNILL